MSIDWINERGHRSSWKGDRWLKEIMKTQSLVSCVRCWTVVDLSCKGGHEMPLSLRGIPENYTNFPENSILYPHLHETLALEFCSWTAPRPFSCSDVSISHCTETVVLVLWPSLLKHQGSPVLWLPGSDFIFPPPSQCYCPSLHSWDKLGAPGSCSVVSDSLRTHGLYSPWNSPGQNTGVGSLSFLQGIFPTQGSNPGLPYCRRILY